jgi:hypothetical protein
VSIDTGYLAPLVDGCPSPEFTLRMSAKAFGLTIETLTEPSSNARNLKISRYRTVAMAAQRAVARQSYHAIGHLFGKRHHTSVMAACERCRRDPILRDALDSLSFEIRQQWAVDHGLPVPPNPNQLSLTDPDNVS